MQRLLLDTHVLIWAVENSPRLGADAREIITDPGNEVFVSAATIWEMAIKRALGKLSFPSHVGETVRRDGFTELPVTFHHAEQAGGLPRHRGDLFDRMLVAQAQAEGLIIVTEDPIIAQYGVRTIRAG